MKESILKLREQGYTYNQIVAELGCSKGTVAYHCGNSQKAKTIDRQRSRRTKRRIHIQEIKASATCMDCGEDYPYYVLEFDHRPDEIKLFNISMYGQYTLEDVKKEIAKCDIVCANCHKIRTWQRMVKTGEGIPKDFLN